jgi:hypothetical protein
MLQRLAYKPSIREVPGSISTVITNNNSVSIVTSHLKTGVVRTPETLCISNISHIIDTVLHNVPKKTKAIPLHAVVMLAGRGSIGPGLRLAQPGGPTARVSVLPFLPEDGRRSSFRNVVILLRYRRWTKSKKPLLHIRKYSSHSFMTSALDGSERHAQFMICIVTFTDV